MDELMKLVKEINDKVSKSASVDCSEADDSRCNQRKS